MVISIGRKSSQNSNKINNLCTVYQGVGSVQMHCLIRKNLDIETTPSAENPLLTLLFTLLHLRIEQKRTSSSQENYLRSINNKELFPFISPFVTEKLISAKSTERNTSIHHIKKNIILTQEECSRI